MTKEDRWLQEITDTAAESIGKLCAMSTLVEHVCWDVNDSWCENPLVNEEDIRDSLHRCENLSEQFYKAINAEIHVLREALKKREIK